jgi:glutathione synthase/RimK-type ligase-like ATP-grasp enzyme
MVHHSSVPHSASPTRIALATQASLPHLNADDRRLVPAFAARGVHATAVVWDDPAIDWSTFDAVVIRSCWDYHLRHDTFLDWVARLERAGVPVFNPPAVIRWNSEKGYLRELAERGVGVVPTRWIDTGSATTLHDVLHDAGWDDAVVKPSISASAHETWRTSRSAALRDEPRFRSLLARGRVLVQPFMREVVDAGEWSLMFLGGQFSHAMLKRARSGDFRVQSEHGGSATLEAPGAHVIEQARRALHAAPGGEDTILYARVDGCIVNGEFVLMELELIEPLLYLAEHPDAPARFADALLMLAAR